MKLSEKINKGRGGGEGAECKPKNKKNRIVGKKPEQ